MINLKFLNLEMNFNLIYENKIRKKNLKANTNPKKIKLKITIIFYNKTNH